MKIFISKIVMPYPKNRDDKEMAFLYLLVEHSLCMSTKDEPKICHGLV